MKKLLIFLVFAFATQSNLFSQSCLPDGITFNTQEQIDNFQADYPGCTEIEGIIEIEGADITNLNGLSSLTNFGDMLYIYATNLTNLTGLDGLTSVNGGIWIQLNNALTSFTGLQNLTTIGGDLLIHENHSIKNFVGLGNLTTIEQDLNIGFNDSLVSLIGLESVSIIGNLYISSNMELTSLAGLDNLNSNINGISISENQSLTSLEGLENLTSINEDLWVSENWSLETLTGLNNLESIGGGLNIQVNHSLANLSSLYSLVAIGGDLSISDNTVLDNISGLQNVTEIGGYVGFMDNDNLLSLVGLNNIAEISGGLTIRQNNSLVNLSGLDNLGSIEGNLNIWDNQNLTNLTGLSSLNSLEGSFTIKGNQSLSSLEGLGEFESGSVIDLSIYDNASLSDCHAQSICDYLLSPNGVVEILNNAPGCNNPPEIANSCGNTSCCLPFGNYYFFTQNEIDNFHENYAGCTDLEGEMEIAGDDISNLSGLSEVISVGGNFSINYCPSLSNLNGLENLTSVGDYLVVKNNDSLTSLFGLDNLSTVGGTLYIVSNNVLPDLTGLESLTILGNKVYISSNAALQSLAGIDNIEAGTISELLIHDNPSLSNCAIESVCDYIANSYGLISIYGNSDGCSNRIEVELACENISVDEIFGKGELEVVKCIPNPINSVANIYLDLPDAAYVNIEICDFTGRKIINLFSGILQAGEQQFTWDARDFDGGVYFLKVENDGRCQVSKLLLME